MVINSELEENIDVFYRDNAEKVQKYENYSRIYSKTFEIENIDIYIHALELSGDVVFEENYFSLLPGEEKKVKFKKAGIGKPSSKAYTI